MILLVYFFSLFMVLYIICNILGIFCTFLDWKEERQEAKSNLEFQIGRGQILKQKVEELDT